MTLGTLRMEMVTQIEAFDEAEDSSHRKMASRNLSNIFTDNRKLLVSVLPNFLELLKEIQWRYYNDNSNLSEVYHSFLKKFDDAIQSK